MKYDNIDKMRNAKAKRERLIEIYLQSDSFDEFILASAAEEGYRCRFFSPFWRAYYSKRHPVIYYSLLFAANLIMALMMFFIVKNSPLNYVSECPAHGEHHFIPGMVFIVNSITP